MWQTMRDVTFNSAIAFPLTEQRLPNTSRTPNLTPTPQSAKAVLSGHPSILQRVKTTVSMIVAHRILNVGV